MSVPEVLDLTNNWLEESRSTNIDGIIGGDANTFVTLKERAEEAKKELEGELVNFVEEPFDLSCQ